MMKMSIKKSCAVLIACALLLSALAVLPKANAANMVDTDRTDCSIDFKTGGDDKVSADIQTTTVDVKLYKVADVNEVGEFTAVGDFAQLDVSALDASNTAAADEWLQRAKDAEGMVTETTEPTATVSLTDGEGMATDLATGLYLVLADKAQTTNYEYTFTPYLIALPNNYYYQTGEDDWIYELSDVVLKPEQTPRYGSLVIDKTVRGFNATSGEQATFVFQIDITTLDGKTESRVEEMTLSADEPSQQLTIDQLPAGATVRVREIYSGASYTQTSDDPDDVTISADETVSVSFVNEHDGRPNGGYGVKNNFKLDENNQYQYTGDNVSTD